ncbi:MAG: 2-phospho-L-lactate guanylyltransferase [Proteobacteria bacterium]|nr:2-phospho-L-lactate guanylyltransferase [Pseudomonadota bacterium]
MGIWAIVPIKSFDSVKKRLASALTPEERRLLMLAMARDVLTALSRSQHLSGTLIVSRAPEADALAQTFGTERFAESPDATLPGALTQAATYLRESRNATGVFIIPADVPLVTATEIDEILQKHQRVSIVPDTDHIGTNALVCSPPDAIPYTFDGTSFKPHLKAARDAGLDPSIVEARGLSLDIDVPDDLLELLRRKPDCQTATYLSRAGISARLIPGQS